MYVYIFIFLLHLFLLNRSLHNIFLASFDFVLFLASWLLEDKSSDSKIHKQVKVRPVHQSTSNQVLKLVLARSVGLSHIVPGSTTNEGTNNHLSDLSKSDDVSREPFRHHLHGRKRIVTIHHSMHRVVHGHKVQARASLSGICVPAVEKDCHVVIPVEEDQRFLSKDNEDGVDKLGKLGEDEKTYPQASSAGSPVNVRLGADGVF
jgi:hypothetical protein